MKKILFSITVVFSMIYASNLNSMGFDTSQFNKISGDLKAIYDSVVAAIPELKEFWTNTTKLRMFAACAQPKYKALGYVESGSLKVDCKDVTTAFKAILPTIVLLNKRILGDSANKGIINPILDIVATLFANNKSVASDIANVRGIVSKISEITTKGQMLLEILEKKLVVVPAVK